MKWIPVLIAFSISCHAQTGNKLIFPSPPDKAFSEPLDIVQYLLVRWPRTLKDGYIQAFDITGRSIFRGSAKGFGPVPGAYFIFENGQFKKYLKP